MRLAFLFLFVLLAVASAADKPNFIIFLIDDLGATDVGCYGSKYYETPQVDRLAAEGMRFRNGYSACTVCSPSRAAMITGQWPARLHLTDWIAGHERPFAKLAIPDWQKRLPLTERTIAQALHEQGYTTAAIGKWHLSPDGPAAHGFDVAIADNHKGQPDSYLSPYKNPNLPDGPKGEELTGRLTDEAIGFIEKNKEKPFFLYLAHFAVHTPLGGKPESIAHFAERAKTMTPQGKPAYGAMIAAVDDSVGRIRARLAELKLADNTVIIFTGDNGGLELGKVTDNLGMRAGKGSAYEGGVRVPFIVYWPGVTKAGTVSDVPVITNDIPATLADIAGAKLPGDGVSLSPLLHGGPSEPRALFWHYPHYHPGGATPHSAIREGDWRLVRFYEDGREELYNLVKDPEEKSDLANAEPDRRTALAKKLDGWLTETKAQMPTPNPKADPAKDKGAGKE